MTEILGDSVLDDNLHHAIDQLQVIVFDLEVLKQQPEIASTGLAKEVGTLTERVFRCSDLLHEIRADNWERRTANPASLHSDSVVCP